MSSSVNHSKSVEKMGQDISVIELYPPTLIPNSFSNLSSNDNLFGELTCPVPGTDNKCSCAPGWATENGRELPLSNMGGAIIEL